MRAADRVGDRASTRRRAAAAAASSKEKRRPRAAAVSRHRLRVIDEALHAEALHACRDTRASRARVRAQRGRLVGRSQVNSGSVRPKWPKAAVFL